MIPIPYNLKTDIDVSKKQALEQTALEVDKIVEKTSKDEIEVINKLRNKNAYSTLPKDLKDAYENVILWVLAEKFEDLTSKNIEKAILGDIIMLSDSDIVFNKAGKRVYEHMNNKQ